MKNIDQINEKVDAGEAEEGTTWPLSSKRKVSISLYAGKTMVSIREFYSKGGRDLPGKKGITLTTDQWEKLFHAAKEIETSLHSIDSK